MPTHRCTAFVALFLVTLVSGCGDSGEDPRAAEMARLTSAVEKLTAANEGMNIEMRRQARQLDGLRRDLAAARAVPQGAAAGPTGGTDEKGEASADDSAGPAAGVDGESVVDPAADPDEEAVEALLATETGRKVIEKAAAKEIAKREERDRRGYVAYAIGVFARDAGLDKRQTKELQRIWKESLDGGVELRKQFAALRELPEDKRAEARAEAMQTMRDLGRKRTEQVNELLTAEQLERYAKTEEEIVASLHGGPRRSGSGRPGPRGEED